MLHAIHEFSHRLGETAFVGIHTGHLGFYADWQPNELDELLSLMVTEHLPSKVVEYPGAELKVETKEKTYHFWALNEFTIKGAHSTLVAKLCINDDPFEMFRGDGIVISTPMGSTAYNKSLGGAIIHPSLPSIQIAEIASINNRVYRTIGSPMILPQHHHCDIYPSDQIIVVFIDHIQHQFENVISLRSEVSERKVRFARYRPFPFWNRVREAFIGELSER